MSGAILAIRTIGTAGGGALAATAAPTTLYGFNMGPGYVTTIGSCTVSVTGGIPPYTYNWTFVSGDTEIEPTFDTQATTTFRANISNTTVVAIWKCVVTDADLTAVDTNTVQITLESTAFPGGGVIP